MYINNAPCISRIQNSSQIDIKDFMNYDPYVGRKEEMYDEQDWERQNNDKVDSTEK